MQINPQPNIRPVPLRRKSGDKLDSSNAIPSFENQVQDSNSKLKRKNGNCLKIRTKRESLPKAQSM